MRGASPGAGPNFGHSFQISKCLQVAGCETADSMTSGLRSLSSQLFRDLEKGQSLDLQAHAKITPWLINRHQILTHKMKRDHPPIPGSKKKERKEEKVILISSVW